MKSLKKLKYKIADVILKKKLKTHKRELIAINLDQAKSIAILTEINSPEEGKIISEFIRPYIKDGVKCKVYGYVTNPTSYTFISDKIYTFFNKDDFNFFIQPKNEDLLNFIKEKWDILILLSQSSHYQLKWLVSLSKSSFIVGPSNDFDNHLDFIIKGEKLTIEDVFNQIKHYFVDLKIIKNKLV